MKGSFADLTSIRNAHRRTDRDLPGRDLFTIHTHARPIPPDKHIILTADLQCHGLRGDINRRYSSPLGVHARREGLRAARDQQQYGADH